MTEMTNPPTWNTRYLDRSYVETFAEELRDIRRFNTCITELLESLEKGKSVTIFGAPESRQGGIDNSASSMLKAMAIIFANAVREENIAELADLGPSIGFNVRKDETIDQIMLGPFVDPAMASEGFAAKGGSDSDSLSLVAYVRAEQTENGPNVSMGCLDLTNRFHYPIPLDAYDDGSRIIYRPAKV